MLWLCAPPSDQLRNRNRRPSVRLCGLGALTELLDPTVTVRVNGVTCSTVPTTSRAPLGLEVNVRFTVRGFSRTVWDVVLPSESVAVNVRSRNDGYSWSGATKLPEATPFHDCTLWAWQF